MYDTNVSYLLRTYLTIVPSALAPKYMAWSLSQHVGMDHYCIHRAKTKWPQEQYLCRRADYKQQLHIPHFPH